ncbi:MAG: PQQ-binding-like beta-propeller repeat protein [Desulfobacteraceae bacterium]|nr:PQQ-binding-like beta-propeller repeat protein [Desulfobacteraceae bacterium]
MNKQKQAEQIVRKYVLLSLGGGFVPVPSLDVAAVAAVQLDMLKQLCQLYGVSYSGSEGKTILSVVAGNSLASMGASAIKSLPGIGTVIGAVSMPILSGASTYALAHAMILHFESDGNLFDLDTEKLNRLYKENFKKGREFASKLWKEREKIQYELRTVFNDSEMKDIGAEDKFKNDRLFIGLSGYILAVEKQTGRELWLNKLPGHETVTVICHDSLLYAGSERKLFVIDPATNKIVWESRIVGKKGPKTFRNRHGYICITDAGKNELFKDSVFIGVNGYILAAEKRTGRELWLNKLPKTGYEPVMLLFHDDMLYAGSEGKFFAADPETGKIMWKNNPKLPWHKHISVTAPNDDYWKDRFFIGVHESVLAIEKQTGQTLWSTSLPGSGKIITVLYNDGMLYAALTGKVFAVEPETGKIRWEYTNRIRWENGLAGLMYGVFVHSGVCLTAPEDGGFWKDRLFIGTHGYVLAIEKHTGRELWFNSLPETGTGIVTMLYEDGLLYAASKGKFFAIDPERGKTVWEKNLNVLGNGHISMASDKNRNLISELLIFFKDEEDKEKKKRET